MDKQEEKLLFSQFKKLYSDFPECSEIHDDKPDFILDTATRKIGIEITEIFIDNPALTGSQIKEDQSFRNKFGNEVLAKLEGNLTEKLEFSISFSRNYKAKGRKLDQDCSTISNVIKTRLSVLHKGDISTIMQEGQLPAGVKKINLFYGLSDNVDSRYMESDGGAVPNLEGATLENVIKGKEKLLSQFEPCDDFWLLIKEGDFYAGSFNDVSLKGTICSSFDKIFLLRSALKEIVELT